MVGRNGGPWEIAGKMWQTLSRMISRYKAVKLSILSLITTVEEDKGK